jgi:hypothetical protein
MSHERLTYTRAAKKRLRMLPAELRMHLETHLENLALLVEGREPERLAQLLAHDEESFVTDIPGARVFFSVAPASRVLLIHRIEAALEGPQDTKAGLTPALTDGGSVNR